MKRRFFRKLLGFGLTALMSLGLVFLVKITPATTMMVSPARELPNELLSSEFLSGEFSNQPFADGASDSRVGDASGALTAEPDAIHADREQPDLLAQTVGARSNRIWRAASFPVENFQTYTSPFGYRRSATGGTSREFHYGLDLAAPNGSYIRSWWMGKVVEVSDDSRCGTSVVVQSGSWEHIYCHMQGQVEVIKGQRYMVDRAGGVQIREGQIVQTGSRIGRVGMTGRTTGPHLHWGMKNKGQWVDPGAVLRAMQASQLS